MIAIILANGFEEIEALCPLDMLRRAGLDVKTVSISDERCVVGAHGIPVTADMSAAEIKLNELSGVIFPGGMPGAKNIDEWSGTDGLIESVLGKGGRLAAICAAPMILGKRGYLKNKRAVCYPGFEDTLIGAHVLKLPVVTDGSITTARGMGAALDFATELVKLFAGEEKALEISSQIMEKKKRTPSAALISKRSLPERLLNAEKTICSYTSLSEELKEEILTVAKKLIETFSLFNLSPTLAKIEHGPSVITYYFAPERDSKTRSYIRLTDDVALILGTVEVRAVFPVDSESLFAYEIPRKHPDKVTFGEMNDDGRDSLSVPVGKSTKGEDVYISVPRLPHLLIGGDKLGARSFLYSSLLSLAKKNSPKKIKILIIDPSGRDFSHFAKLAHVYEPIVNNSELAESALSYMLGEMERRYSLIISNEVRTIDAYNAKMKELGGETLPRIIVAVTNFCEIKNEKNELYIMALAQKARAAGIHLLVLDSGNSRHLPGTVKANIPSRLCFKTSDTIESRKILDMNGAERLTALNDALYLGIGYTSPVRLTAISISENELSDELDLLKCNSEARTRLELSPAVQTESKNEENDGESSIFSDERFIKAVELTLSSGTISISLLQRKLGIGYALSAKLMDYMEAFGLISEPNGQLSRKLLMSREEWENFIKDKVN